MFCKIKKVVFNSNLDNAILKAILIFSTISMFVIIPIVIIKECPIVEIIVLFVYSISGFTFYLIGYCNINKIKKNNSLQEQQIKDLYEMTITDSLTQIYNRKFLFEKLSEFSNGILNRGVPVSLIIFDIDHFKKVNDSCGHLEGDSVLRELADVVSSNIRSTDIFGRYGGEEFMIISPNTEIKEIEHLAENIRKKVNQYTDVTISIGVSKIESNEDVDFAIKRADDAMYRSKDKGRNTISVG